MAEEEQLQYDLLNELFNISVGQAASLLSEMVERTIVLNVPKISIVNIENSTSSDMADFFLPIDTDDTLMVSSICFDNKLTGKANLIFPASKMRTFIDLCLKEGNTETTTDLVFSDIDFDVIREIGNIILNCIVGGVSNSLKVSLDYSIPEVRIYDRDSFTASMKAYSKIMILLYISFVIDDTEIDGAIMINLSLFSLKELMDIIKKMEDEING